MKNYALTVQDLSVSIGSRQIIKNVGFQADTGEFIGIIGPNGAGKSTLLRGIRAITAGPSTGTVMVFGKSIKGMRDKSIARWVAYMQQEVNMDFGFTALEVVLAGRYPYLDWWRNEREEDYAIARRYMAFTGVEKLAEKSAREVSGGERQRILLAKVLAQETPLIFLDEPTASLDLTYQEEIFRYCQHICATAEEKKTVLMVVHDIRMAAKFCSRLILLADGEIIADGTPEEVVTAANLERAYGLHAVVFKNPIAGNLDLHTYKVREAKRAKTLVHIVGSGNGAASWIRLLFEKGIALNGGIFYEGEIDAEAARIFGVNACFASSYAGISPEDRDLSARNQAAADWTLLPELIYTPQNIALLESCLQAKRVLVVEDSSVEIRDFSGGHAKKLYEKLIQQPQSKVITSEKLLQCIKRNVFDFFE